MPKSSRVYIAIWLSFTTIVVAQQDQQEDYHSRSVELDSQSYDNSRSATSKLRHSQDYSYSRSAQNDTQSYSSQSRSPLSRQFKDNTIQAAPIQDQLNITCQATENQEMANQIHKATMGKAYQTWVCSLAGGHNKPLQYCVSLQKTVCLQKILPAKWNVDFSWAN